MYGEILNCMKEYNSLLEGFKNKKFPITISGVFGSQKAHMVYSISNDIDKKIIYIAPNEIEAFHMYKDLLFFLKDEVLLYKSREIIFYDVMARSNDDVYDRIIALEKVVSCNYKIIVTSVDAISQKIIEKDKLQDSIIKLSKETVVDLQKLSKDLIKIGYDKQEFIESKGQYSIRGGIIDIFSIEYDNPVRIELFGDQIDSIRFFDKDTQRSKEVIDEVRILPAKDLFYNEDEREVILNQIKGEIKNYEYIERAENDYNYSTSDKFWPFIAKSSLFDYVKNDVLMFLDGLDKFEEKYKSIENYHKEMFSIFFDKGYVSKSCVDIIFRCDEIKNKLYNIVYLSLFKGHNANEEIYFETKQIPMYNGHVELFAKDLKKIKDENYKVLILAGDEKRANHLVEILDTYGIQAIYSDNYKINDGQVVVSKGELNSGFSYPKIRFTVISDIEIFGKHKSKRKKQIQKDRKAISLFTDLKVGDFVVHHSHGIGKYVGVEQLVVDNIKKDYLKIQYYGDDVLYIPINQLDLIQKYIGQDARVPRLNKLGTNEWNRLKNKVKESVEDIARDLIELYAKRRSVKGYEFLPDTIWQKQFEDLFPYQETDAQLKSIEEVKKDMESPRPMERLLCGDVGFGKTEVALRAIFKACMSGKQVAYLVPTTVLAHQHYTNFKERMKDFPIVVEVLDRCKSTKEQKNILKRVKTGEVDILIGTHRILQKDVEFKDLGFLVVDEEQRFGVKDKEKIKGINNKIDVLSLSATPIPRTLHMSLSGIKDISILDEAPKERYPVNTYVLEYDEGLIKEAISKEVSRGGQVFYLYNRVESIDSKAVSISNMLKDIKVAVVHGRMDKRKLENTILEFINKEYDVLVCTTIIESGIDMPNVNTLIIEDADKMGLSQLYQLRGRVGRSNKLGYAYITYRKNKVINEVARERLKAVKEFTEFGSGFKIAMRDMQIRGAGSIIGAKQHGHMEAVGYEMYTRLLENAIKEQKGEVVEEESIDVTIDLNVNSYIDNIYINDEEQKIAIYKKIAAIKTEDDAMDIYDELIDRFGSIPNEVDNLLQISVLKNIAKNVGVESIQQKDEVVIFQFGENKKINIALVSRLVLQYPGRLLLTASNKPYLTYKIKNLNDSSLVINIKKLLQNINKLQNDD